MISVDEFRFATRRLKAARWHTVESELLPDDSLSAIVRQVMTPAVTRSLPPSWQGEYTAVRAEAWIAERDSEGVTLLVRDAASGKAVGLVILHGENGKDYRLGYMLRESCWGQGLASELIAGLTRYCRAAGLRSVTGGVARDNAASRRVLEKNGFEISPESIQEEEQLFSIRFESRAH